jgi:hypothetical protein
LKQASIEIEKLDEEKIYSEEIPQISKPRVKPMKLSKKEAIDLTATAIDSTPAKVVVCEYCLKEGQTKVECWIFLATQDHRGRCKES